MRYFYLRLSFWAMAALCLCQSGQAAPAVTAKSAASKAALSEIQAAPTAAQYPNAGAVWLRDEQTDHLHTDGTYVEQIHQIIRIHADAHKG